MADEWDAVVVGAGPNGLTAAATLGRAGWRVLVVEAAPTIGGGTRSGELTRPGFVHDICSAVHPDGPHLSRPCPSRPRCPRRQVGASRRCRWPTRWTADGPALLVRSVAQTAAVLGPDQAAYRALLEPLVESAERVVKAVLSPLSPPPRRATCRRWPDSAAAGAWPATRLARSRFSGPTRPRGSWPAWPPTRCCRCSAPATGGYGLFLGLLGHAVGWPVASGGSQAIADALAAIIVASGGEIVVGQTVESLDELPPARATLLDVSPRQLIGIAGHRLPARYRRALERYRYGAGGVEGRLGARRTDPVDRRGARQAATVHVGGTARRGRRGRGRRGGRTSAATPVRAGRAADDHRPEPGAGRRSRGLGLLPCAQRVDLRHDRNGSRTRSSGSPRASGNGCSPVTP